MVKLGKSKFKALNKLAKKQQPSTNKVSNKVLKKKFNAEKKVIFQKEVLFKEAVTHPNPLVQNITTRQVQLDKSLKITIEKKSTPKDEDKKTKVKHVEKHKKRQETQINDTKLLINLMNKKK